MTKWNDKSIKHLIKLATEESELTWQDIGEKLHSKFPDFTYTGEACRKAFARYKDMGSSDDDFLKNLQTKRSTQKRSSRLAKENRVILDEMERQANFLDQFKSVLKESEFKIHKPIKRKNKKTGSRTIVAHLSDTHFGSDIKEDEMGGLNNYGVTEEARRLAFFTKEVADYKKEYRKDTDLVLVINGDIIQGVIHDQDSTPTLTNQFARALSLLSQSISYLANEFNSIKVISTIGNHSRAQHKENKGRPTRDRWDSYGTMLNVALEYALRDFNSITFEFPITPYWYGKIRGHDYFILHSDTVLSTGSIGKSVNVNQIKNKINDLITGIGNIDVVMAGHTHIELSTLLANGVTLLCNGNLSGVDPFCLSLGIVVNNPSQQLFEVTDKYCVGDLRNVRVKNADKDSSLDKIIKPFTRKY